MRKQGRLFGARGNVQLGTGGGIKFNLPFIIFEEDNTHFCYCPALDITGYGNTEQEAMDSIYVMLEEYFDYTAKKRTLAADLKRLGWHIKNSLKKKMTPPDTTDLLRNNREFKRVFNNLEYRKVDKEINIPAFA